jgi:hypothetical protein
MNLLAFIIAIILGTVVFFIVNLKSSFHSGRVLIWSCCCLATFLVIILLGKILKLLLILIVIGLLIAVIVKVLSVKW